MGSTVVNLRSKALRGLGNIVVADPDVLRLDIVKTGIEDRLSDSSPAVRDAAVDLIGKYIVQRSELADQYFDHISMRVTDAGLGVRKRVVKLLRDMFNVTNNDEVKTNICCKLIEATNDEDDGVKDLAVKSLTEILCPPSNFDPAQAAALLVDVIKDYRGKDESLKAALEAVGANGQTQRYAEIIDSLISRMVDATEQSEFNATSHIKAIALLSFDDPALIDNQKATVLLTYLRTATNADEARTNELLLEIFTRSIPFMPKASSSFAQELSKIVRGFVGKPPNIDALKNIVACYCAVTKHLTQEWAALFMVLRSCLIQIRAKGLANASSPAIAMVYFITALITEFAKPEELAAENSQVEDIIRGITDEPLQEYLLDNYIAFSGAASSQKVPSLCLAALFRAYPPLILQEKSAVWMQRVFSSDDMENKGKPKKQGVDDLIGSAADLHESGVSTALVQRNIDYVIAGAKSNHAKLQSAAMEVFEFTINQGLYHPLHAGADRHIAEQALNLHSTLHTKHPSLLNVRYLEFARSSYDYLRTITAEPVGHYNGTPGLGGWYDLLSEKRAWRLEFLRALVKAFDFELMGNEKIEPGFVLYIAENLSTFNYQLQEEVMSVVQHLSHVVSEGTAVANAIELGKVMGMEDESLADKVAVVSEFNAQRLANASIVVGIALLLKNLLLDGYGLTEDKCLKFVPGKKSALGDRAATNRYTKAPPLDHSRIPLVHGVETVRDFWSQQATFLHMMREDGMLGQMPPL
ncbi:IDN3-B protein [Trichosporon asahii var. asahii CBS 2479]|uniref:Sister chromatid cohesion protein n=1 Tax=Trichosporon asahii var. asahii (strain ATCC 90039 / CBS 2479 / JCM 2466 / KCTC 7840 / NBRC 103889/ NCYC 2677 / UAMH 7654) TaxID=1186058 RepID=J6EQC9_TRIAS|nr:IDN3-B protein [Trichosporon asahii var. asahii CBS 2479]EJT46679.1 IDN3-B protein [Trichosporon asahii var. asahii CBS 2479]